MPLITPEQLIVYLDLPADTQPTDRAQLVCDLVIDAVTKAAGGTAPTVPYPAGLLGITFAAAGRLYDNPIALRSKTVGSTSSTYGGDVVGILTKDEKDEIAAAVGAGGPRYSFPAWDYTWAVTGATLVEG